MEVEKRKRVEEREMEGKKSKVREEEGGKAVVEDEEVEEFFEILRRIQVAVKYFKKSNGESGREVTVKGSRLWGPSFEWKDFNGVNGGEGQGGVEEEEEKAGLDLNAEPGSDSKSV
ncbi:unnamed protein product [Ilex paraguariensis]|uniref:Uncharacterized protein n=1 Tax=Ilex paraguariensis TaxID=185542 RepID=A0ABC8U9E0_9AQUA